MGLAPVQETTQSDIRSMSVDPGSLDEQLSSQGSVEGGGGGGAGGVAVESGVSKKRGEFSGGMDESSELVIVSSETSGTGTLRPDRSNVSGLVSDH